MAAPVPRNERLKFEIVLEWSEAAIFLFRRKGDMPVPVEDVRSYMTRWLDHELGNDSTLHQQWVALGEAEKRALLESVFPDGGDYLSVQGRVAKGN